jgi:mannose-1-phosphate guanylyltransferase
LALRTAKSHQSLVLLGVVPTRPETGYGYILPGDPLGGGAWQVKRFEEKPDRRKAQKFLRKGDYLWNCGIFAWTADSLESAVQTHLPRMAQAFKPLSGSRTSPKKIEQVYARTPAISVDYGLLEVASNVAVVPCDFVWDDLGSWAALERIGSDQGFSKGENLSIDAEKNILWSEDGMVAVLGISGIVVVHTPDATLVVAKERAQDVRALVSHLAKTKKGKQFLSLKKRK